VSTLPLEEHNRLLIIAARARVDAEEAQETATRLQRDADVLSAAIDLGLTHDESAIVRDQLHRFIERERLKRGAR
jgi:hypothetical protein